MNNYANTEKSLKRWLKNRVKITIGTVVGFLIAGTVAFGAIPEIPTGDGVITIDQPDKQHITTSENTNENGKIVVDGKNTNNGGQTSSAFSVTQSGISLSNKGDIWVTDSGVKGYAQAMGNNYQVSGTIINEGNIYVLGKDNGFSKAEDRVKGMAIDAGKAYNRGTIIVTDGVAMTDNSGTTEKTIINDEKGKIIVEGTGAGIYHRKEAITNGSIENKGTIEVTGKGTGVLISNDKNEESYNGKSFTNSGTIIANNGGKAISSSSKNFTLNLEKGSHIEGLIKLNGTDNTVNIDGVGTADKPEINNIESNDVNVKINNSNVVLEGSLKSDLSEESIGENKGTLGVVQLKAGNGTVTNKAEITGEVGVSTQDWALYNKAAGQKFINDGIINAEKYGIYSNAQIGTYIENIVNNKGIAVKGDNSYGIYAAGLAETGANAKTYVENNGEIKVEGKNSIGFRIHENASALNTKTVENVGEEAKTVVITGGANAKILDELKSEYVTFKNEGILSANGKNSIGLLLNHQAAKYLNEYNTGTQDVTISAVNEKDGKIAVTGEGTIGVKLTSDKREGLNSQDVKVNFANNGIIELGEGTTNGTGILVEAGTVLNEGTIALGMNGTGNIAINNIGGVAKNTGIIKVTDMTKDEIISSVNKEEALDYLFDGEVDHLGLIVDKEDNALFLDEDTTVKEDTTTEILDGLAQGNGTVGVDGDLTITGTGDNIVESEVFNVTGGTATIEGEVVIDSGKINLDGEGKFAIGEDSSLTLENGTLDKVGEGTAIEANGTLALDNMTVNGDIEGTGTINITGNGELNGSITGTPENKITINFGNVGQTFALRNVKSERALQEISADGEFSNAVISIGSDIQLGLEVKVDGTNRFGNSNGMELTGTGNEDVIIRTGNLSGNEIIINLGENKYTNVDMITDSEIYIAGDVIDKETGKDEIIIKYNDKLYEGNEELSAIHKAASVLAGGTFAGTKAERDVQLDKIYSTNIYSETVRAAYDNVKLNEEAVESLARKSEVGKWTAEGKALYSKNEYDRKGIVGDYSSEIESTGLMAAFGYGINETTTAGIALSGVKQDVDTDGGSADADLFYLGVYGNKVVGNYDFTAGLGYQFGEYDADNTIANVHGSDKYDTQALSGYVQGRYTADLGDGLSIQPKVKLGYTYIDQDNAKDSYFGVSDAEISTFDAEAGFDVVKSVQLEKTKVDVKFGASYIKAMGDTDKEFEGRFYGTETSNGFDVLGAELAENTVKFNLGAEAVNENGFFYNGGFTYEFGSDDTEAYGVKAGVGYKF